MSPGSEGMIVPDPDPYALNLNQDSEFWPNLDPNPRVIFINFEICKKKVLVSEW